MLLPALNIVPEGSGWLTRAGLVTIAVVGMLLARRLLPRSWRAEGVAVPALAVVVAYATIRIGADSGFSEWLDHDVFERVGGETDDFPTWLTATVAAAVVFALARFVRTRRR